MLKDHSDDEKGNPLPGQRDIWTKQKGFFYMHHPTERIAHTTAFVTQVVEHWLEPYRIRWKANLNHNLVHWRMNIYGVNSKMLNILVSVFIYFLNSSSSSVGF